MKGDNISQRRTITLFRAAVITVLNLLIINLFQSSIPGEILRHNYFFRIRGPIAPAGDVILVKIDWPSYGELGISPLDSFPRRITADLLRRLKVGGVAGVAFDFPMPVKGPDEGVDSAVTAAFRELPLAVLPVLATDPDPLNHVPSFVIPPYTPFEEALRGRVGNIAQAQDSDGAVYISPHSILIGDRFYPPLASLLTGIGVSDAAARELEYVNYYGPNGTIPGISIYKIMRMGEEELQATFSGKRVIVGQTFFTNKTADRFKNPFPPKFFVGAELQATIAQNMIDGSAIRRFDPRYEGAGICAVLFSLLIIILSMSGVRGLAVACVGALCYLVISYVGFLHGYFIPGVVAFLVTCPLVACINAAIKEGTLLMERLQFRKALSAYVGPDLVDDILNNPVWRSTLTSKEQAGVVLFVDLADSTKISSALGPKRYSALLNDFFDTIARPVVANCGVPLSFPGDAMIAAWIKSSQDFKPEEHTFEDLALRAATQMISEVRSQFRKGLNDTSHFAKHLLGAGIDELRIRIGIASGSVVIGNSGSIDRLTHTVLGAAVAEASRLEKLAKDLKVDLLFTSSVYDHITVGRISSFCLATGKLAGFADKTGVFTVYNSPIEPAADDLWREGLAMIANQDCDFAGAARSFQSAADLDPRLAAPATHILDALVIHGIGIEFKPVTIDLLSFLALPRKDSATRNPDKSTPTQKDNSDLD